MTPKEAQRFTKLLQNTDDMTPLEKAEVGRLKTAYLSAVIQETEAYVAAKEAYEEQVAIKRTRDSYNLIKWDVCRKLEDQRREADYLKKRR